MSKSDMPAGDAGGSVTVPGLDDLPERMRVHALARLLGRTSREVLAALAELGLAARSAQSSIDRKAAEQVAVALVPGLGGPDGDASDVDLLEDPVAPTGGTDPADDSAPVAPEPPVLAPIFAPPLFVPAAADDTTTEERDRAAAEPSDVAETADTADVADVAGDDDEASEGDDSGSRRRRRRGRRGRGRGRGGEGDGADTLDAVDDGAEPLEGEPVAGAFGGDAPSTGADTADDEADEADESAGDDGDAATKRRRRRRRRRGGVDDTGGDEPTDDRADPPNTVVKVRAPRERPDDADGDGVQSVRGSTRLEAKRQRRRDGRDAGRRRVPILTEAEFLARRESVDRSMVVRERGDRVEIGVLEDGVLVEHFVAGGAVQNGNSLVGNIYLGRVQNVLPSMEAAFVDIGRGRNAVLYAGEVDWDAAGLGGRARRIEQALSSGDSVLVQVTKDPVGHKGARLTTQISLAGRFLVYVPSGGAAGISRKLPDVERKRLRDLLREIVPSEAGVIIRTASEGVSQEALERDVRRLQAQWDVVRDKSEKSGPNRPKAPVLLYEEPDMLIKVIRDQFNEDFSRLVVEGDDAWETVSHYVAHVAPELVERLHRHVGTRDVFEEHRIDEQLLKALDRKVWLPSGGTLVIDRTEAMTVIDVNTGKFTGSGGNLEETVTRNNLEAAEEIVRQLRLRDIGGIIVIDFIDMVLEANRDLVLRRLTECLARDRTRHQVAEVTSLGLVQMTRKRVGGGLLEHFSTPCEHCRGRGVVVSAEPVAAPNDERGDRGERGGRERNGDAGGRRSRGRGRRDDADTARRGRDAGGRVEPDGEVVLDVGAPLPPIEVEPDAAVAPATVESVRDDVEEVVVEQALAAARNSHLASAASNGSDRPATPPDDTAREQPTGNGVAPAPADVATADAGTPPADPVDAGEHGSGGGSARTRRRGRVTRTGGAPTTAAGEAPAVAVVTVPSRPDEVASAPESSGPPDVTASDAAPAPIPRTRRARRAASRPAGPPAPDLGDAGDPV
jgi:ribonuclease E